MKVVSKVLLLVCRLGRTKAVGILDPIHPVGSFGRSGIDINVVKDNIGSVHHVDSPELRLYDVEIANIDIANIPEHEWHWPARTCRAYGGTFGLVPLVPVPDLTVAIDTARTMAINAYVITSQDKTSCVILELDVVVVVPPVFEILRELEVRQYLYFIGCTGRGPENSPTTLPSNQCSRR
jgi:hypothetical protein